MSSTRQDAWTHDEDLLLAEVVLRHIRDGGTQLQAFEEVGKQMNRTAAACGFRWNSYVRKQYKSGIELAKKQRKEQKGKNKLSEPPLNETVHVEQKKEENGKINQHIQEVISFLQQLQNEVGINDNTEKENLILQDQIKQLQYSYQELQKRYEKQKNDYEALQKEYSSMIAILDRARKLSLQHSE
ncbi:RsfA family transcriptional regulator [Heyndrickxia oleronia]|uniref:RsfA family transcriptional regulator n=1 Tax=Heyndrickxia oleronia TaxID=38875 RepID=UPI00203F8C0C|nr:RsfA family transcriptional regulator [Heyndrickxia oleronia]MCM3237833.1 RsfA family transcriptional regulator [Heyndrickxia oleronia]